MISIEEALDKIVSQVEPLGTDTVCLNDAAGRALARDISSARDQPPMDNSAMDGFALRFEDVREASENAPVSLNVIGELPAGYKFDRSVGPGQALKIMTGAMIPQGADTVVQVEHTTDNANGTVSIVKAPGRAGLNIRIKGEYIRRGDVVFGKGAELLPRHLGLLASLGLTTIPVYSRPTVSIVATGDEIVDPASPTLPAQYQIINSNSVQLTAQVIRCGGAPVDLGIARDVEEEVKTKFLQGAESDIIISTGGVSVGSFDYVKAVLEESGSELIFWKVAIKPGKPLVFGRLHGKLFFGLPGNPVASFIAFHLFVKPALRKLGGFSQYLNQYIRVRLESDIHRKVDKRKVFISALIRERDGETVGNPLPNQSSANLKLFRDATGFVILPGEKALYKKGELVSAFYI